MNYPYSRHFQRYEFVLTMGYIDPESVIDIGSGRGAGSVLLTSMSKNVIALDPLYADKDFLNDLKTAKLCLSPFFPTDYMKKLNPPGNLYTMADTLDEFYAKWKLNKAEKLGSAITTEVIEHVGNPLQFISTIAKITNKLFITTPLSDVTKKTTHPYHVLEFSKNDFEDIVSSKFSIVSRHYQHGNLTIDEKPTYLGDSMNHAHTTQMLWCKKK